MSISRRIFLAGAGTGATLFTLAACTSEKPTPTKSLTPTPAPTSPVPRPSALLRSGWTVDPFALGATSFLAVGSTPQHRTDLATPIGGRVFFAGEATSIDFPGSVLGAQTSGSRAASEVADAADSGDKIAVIGAGVAGAEAARILTQQGFDVVVIEARDRVGGRIDSRTSKAWPGGVELGAWRLDKTIDAELLGQLGNLGVATNPLTGTRLQGVSAEASSNPVGAASFSTATAWAADQLSDPNLSVALDKSGADKTAAASDSSGLGGADLLDSALASLATVTGASAPQLSGWFGLDDVPTPGRVVTGGFHTLVTDALDGIKPSLSTTVTGISYGGSDVSLTLGTGESLSVDRVIVTVPLGVLKTGSIKFSPLLPFSHRTAIDALGFGAVETVWFRFTEPFWTSDAAVWSLVGSDSPITDFVNLQAVSGEPVIVGIVGGSAARRVAKLSDDDLLDLAQSALVGFA